MEKILRLQRLGRNYWGNIAYEDKESGKIYFDIEDGHSDNPQLYTSSPSDDIDGEPNFPITLKSASNLNGNLNCSKELEHYAS